MHEIARDELLACWVLFLAPFVWRSLRPPDRRPVATLPRARWGMAIQALAYVVASVPRGPHARAAALASMLLAPAAVALAWMALRALGSQWRLDAGVYQDHELVRGGPYRFVRHPVYSSMLLILLAHGLLQTTWPFLLAGVALLAAGTEIRVRTEDRILRAHFGKQFDAYRRAVRAWLPWLR